MDTPSHGMSPFARNLVKRLGLRQHPEGGWYARDWQSEHLDASSGRPLSSLIYFLLPQGACSAWHKVDADELWLWHGPHTLTLQLGGEGDAPAPEKRCRSMLLGAGLSPHGQTPGEVGDVEAVARDGARPAGHALVPAGVWQRTLPAMGDVLVSCVVSPGFVFSGFTLGK